VLLEAPFPDAEDVALDLFATVAPTYTALPVDLSQPVISVHCAGGPTDLHTYDPTVVVQCYAPDRDTAWVNARQCLQILLSAVRKSLPSGQIDRTWVIAGLQQPPYDDPAVFRVTGTYGLSFRRPRA
jgi:hypothetical protein